MIPRPPILRCGSCGYDVASVMARDPDAPCPECGSISKSDHTVPWPSPAAIAWQLVRVQAVAAGVTLALASVSIVGWKQGWSFFAAAMGGSSLIVGLLALVLLVFWPISASLLIAERYCPEMQRTAIQTVLLLLGWGASLVTALVFLIALWMLSFVLA